MSAKQEDFDIAIGFKDAPWGYEFEPDEDKQKEENASNETKENNNAE